MVTLYLGVAGGLVSVTRALTAVVSGDAGGRDVRLRTSGPVVLIGRTLYSAQHPNGHSTFTGRRGREGLDPGLGRWNGMKAQRF